MLTTYFLLLVECVTYLKSLTRNFTSLNKEYVRERVPVTRRQYYTRLKMKGAFPSIFELK